MGTEQVGVEKKIIATSTIFVLALAGVIALSVKLYSIDLPTCLTDVKPFTEGKLIQQGPERYEVHYVAKMWKFEPAEISITPGSTVDVYLATPDVTHGMQIVGTNVNLMAVPGVVNFARVRFTRPGDYLVVCNEYCGAAHHNMAGVIHVTADAPPVTPPPTPEATADARGLQLLDTHACTACHSVDGSEGPGPTLKGLYGSQRQLVDGSTVTADEAYLREAIVSPEAKIVKNFDDSMPPADIPPDELDAIIAYMKTLK
ncbi:MAG: c-type cytochrome [Thermoanaerobaculia bacterium]